MLEYMRRNANSWVMVVLFAIIIFVFAINFGPWAGNSMQGVPYAAVVNNQAISMAEFRSAYSNQLARIKQFRPDYEQDQAEKDGLKQLVLDQLISRELLTQLGKKHNLSVGAKTLALEIKDRVFGKDAEFDKDEYVRRINAYFQTTVAQFEKQVAKEMIAELMGELLGTAVHVSDAEAKMSYRDRETKIAVEFVKVDPTHYKSTRVIPADEIKAYQTAHSQELSSYYQENIGNYVKDETIRASHILVKVPSGTADADKGQFKDKAEKILARLKDGEDFATLAKAESDDEGTKIKGGDLDYFSAGMMVEEFSKAAFALKPDELSSVVETPFGFHIIKQTDKKPKVERKLDEVSAEIAEVLIRKDEQNELAKKQARLALDQLKNGTPLAALKIADLVNNKASGKPAAPSSAPVADETDLFSQTAPFVQKIGRVDASMQKVFDLTLTEPTASDLVEMNGNFFAFRVKARQDADMTKFEEEKEKVKMSLLYPRKRAFMQQVLAEMKENAKITYNEMLTGSPAANS